MSKLKYPSMKSLQNGEIHTIIFPRVKAVTQLFIIVYKNNTDWRFKNCYVYWETFELHFLVSCPLI